METKREQCRRFLSLRAGESRETSPNRRAGCPPRGGIRRACGEPPGRNRRAQARDEPVGRRRGMVEPAVWGRRRSSSILSHQGVCGWHGGKDARVTRGGLVASRRWQAGKQTYKQPNCEMGSDARRGVGQPNSTDQAMGNHEPPSIRRHPGVGWGSRLATTGATGQKTNE